MSHQQPYIEYVDVAVAIDITSALISERVASRIDAVFQEQHEIDRIDTTIISDVAADRLLWLTAVPAREACHHPPECPSFEITVQRLGMSTAT